MEISVGDAVSGVKEMLHSVNMNPRRSAFYQECSKGNYQSLQTFFPVSTRAVLEKNIRLTLCRLGIYSFIKRLAKALIKDFKRS